MHMTSGQVLTRLLKLDPAWTLEEMWRKGQRTWGQTDSVAIEQEVEWPKGGKSIYLRDPAGNLVELVTPGMWGLSSGW
jgi:hypothetical protein